MPTPTLRPFQSDLKAKVYNAWNNGAKNVLMRLDTGGGKCLGRGTPVLMFDGSIKSVESVRVGDSLMGPDSRPRRVLSICSGRERLYRVIPKRGDPYVVNESHILSLRQTNTTAEPQYPSEKLGGQIVNLAVTEYLKKADRWKHKHKGWRTAVEFPTKIHDAALPPYMLGIWLGDGSSKTPSVTTCDSEIVEYLCDFAVKNEQFIRREKAGGRFFTYHLTGIRRWRDLNPFLKALQRNELIGNKHVPLIYKTGSRKQRLELLAGLIDTDGYYTGKGFDFISVNKTLADDVAYVARSLGFSANVKSAMKSCNGGPKAEYWRMTISGDVEQIPCRVARKQAVPRRQKKSVLMTGIDVEPLGEGDYFGFEIDGDRLFLLGDFTVTHNTVVLSDINREHQGHSRIIAHRQELVLQLSVAVARNGVRHNVVTSDNVRRAIAKAHVEELGYSLIDGNSTCLVGSVDTMVKRDDPYAAFVTQWTVDEGHHVVVDNKWHRLLARYTHPNCVGLLPTATPKRADGKGLGRDYDGVADLMVEGPPMRWLIDQGYLCDYRIFCPPSDLQMLEGVAASGDWSTKQLREAAKRSHIVGDVVASYLNYAPGKLGITFSTDIETAMEITRAYQLAGVKAETLTGKTDDYLRRSILRQFENRQIEQIVAVDIISEGFDLPAIEVASFARPTESLALYMQQFGRTLRPMPGKDKALIIDHVGNVIRHQGPPDKPRIWGLERRDKRSKPNNDAIPIKVCPACYEPFEAIYRACPHCGHYEPPSSRGSPKMVAGDLQELDPQVLARLRDDVAAVDMSIPDRRAELMKTGLPHVPLMAQIKHHDARQQAQAMLRRAMAFWGGQRKAEGLDDAMIQRAFFFRFGISVIEAVALGREDATKLTERVLKYDGG